MTTMVRGMKMTGKPPELVMEGTICMMPMMRKYTLGSFENCSSKFNGIKSMILYLLVVMLLSVTL